MTRFSQARTPVWLALAFLPLGDSPLTASDPGRPIEVVPRHVRLTAGSSRQQLVVTGFDTEGQARDLTRSAVYSISPAGVADVSASGVVTTLGVGEAIVRGDAGGTAFEVPVVAGVDRRVRPTSYLQDVVPLLSKGGCNAGACHGNLTGKGGFRLSLRGEDPGFDLTSLTRDALGRRINLARPGDSLFLRKPTGQIPHEGGARFGTDSPEAETLRDWVTRGARGDLETAPRLTRLDIFPEERIAAASGRTQQLAVTATFSDGTRRDVTRQASYDVSDPTQATVSPDGLVEVTRPTETAVAVRYLDGRAVSRLTFLNDRPGFVFRAPQPRDAIDTAVFARLKLLKINPSPIASDAVFLRRASMDAVGRLPTPDESRAFLADPDPSKRSRLVDSLLARPEFADFWALKWADLLRNEEKTMGVKGGWVLQRWLRDRLAADVPMTQFARELIVSKGSTYSSPASSFYRTNRDPTAAAESVAQVFLGVRLQCARCHNHPSDVWTQDDYYGLAAFFGNVVRKEMNVSRKDRFDKHEINGDESIYVTGRPGIVQPRSGKTVLPKPPRGPAPDLNGQTDARPSLAAWLTEGNRQFARNLANRVWFHLLGRGIVDPVDDFRESNPPSNPALLDVLTDSLIANGYRLRPVVAMIMKSQTYQLSSTPDPTNADDETHFARATVRLLPAEVLLDALGTALDHPARFANAPRGANSAQLPGAGNPFLKVFGKPDRLLSCECERSETTTLAQAFQLINGDAVRGVLEAEDNRIGRLLASGRSDDAILDELTLAALCRTPSPSERVGFVGHVRDGKDRRKAWEDVAWALVNSKEFLLRH